MVVKGKAMSPSSSPHLSLFPSCFARLTVSGSFHFTLHDKYDGFVCEKERKRERGVDPTVHSNA